MSRLVYLHISNYILMNMAHVLRVVGAKLYLAWVKARNGWVIVSYTSNFYCISFLFLYVLIRFKFGEEFIMWERSKWRIGVVTPSSSKQTFPKNEQFVRKNKSQWGVVPREEGVTPFLCCVEDFCEEWICLQLKIHKPSCRIAGVDCHLKCGETTECTKHKRIYFYEEIFFAPIIHL